MNRASLSFWSIAERRFLRAAGKMLSKRNVSVEDASDFRCPACGHKRAVTIGPTHGGYYRRCLDCGLEVRIVSDAESASGSFDASQSTCYGDDDVLNPPSMRVIQRQSAAARLRIIRRYLPEGKLLEVGPGGGELVELARAEGYEVAAIEHSPTLAQRLAEELGIRVACGMFEKMDLSGQAYDGVVSMHVIEHVPDPLKHMLAARAVVAAGGYLFLATPNLEAWTRRIAGIRWPGYSAAHLHLFRASSLTRWLGQAGWKVVGVHTNEHVSRSMWSLLYLRRKPRGVRPLKQAGAVARRTPSALTAAAISVLGILTWPMRRLQSALGGGYEIVLVARAAEQVASTKECQAGGP